MELIDDVRAIELDANKLSALETGDVSEWRSYDWALREFENTSTPVAWKLANFIEEVRKFLNECDDDRDYCQDCNQHKGHIPSCSRAKINEYLRSQ